MPYNVEDLIRLYEETSSGFFFSKDTMRFFKSRVTSNFRRIDDKRALFITTEQCANKQRMATIRIAELVDYAREDGRTCHKIQISTSPQNGFNKLTLAQAKRVMNVEVQS